MTTPVHQAVLPLLLIPVLLALGFALSPRFMLRWLGWFIALNLLLVACMLAAESGRSRPALPAPSSTTRY